MASPSHTQTRRSQSDSGLASHNSSHPCPVPVNERVLQVLTHIARHGSPVSARDIAAQVQLPLSTLYRQLAPLKKWGLVQEHAQSGLYEPGPLAVQLAWGFDHYSYLMAEARDEIETLVRKSGESVGLLTFVNGQAVCLDMQDSEQALRCSFTKGKTNSPVRGASAKALLAHLPSQSLQAVLGQHLPGQQEDHLGLLQDLEQIRQRGYAISENEVDEGVWGVSAPILSEKGKLEATLSLMAPVQRAQSRQHELIQMTVAAAARIQKKLRNSL